MGIFDIFSGGARDDMSQGYGEAAGYLNPYMKGGATDYGKYRDYAGNFGNNLAPYANTGSYQYNQINQSPAAYYDHIMQGYSESPQAKYEQEQAMRAANAGGAASGMLGSGAYQKAIQQNAADISGRDQQRYFGNVQGANQMQMGYLGDLRNQQSQFNAMQQYLANLGYGGATAMGANSINRGLANAQLDRQNVQDWMSVAGTAAGFIP